MAYRRRRRRITATRPRTCSGRWACRRRRRDWHDRPSLPCYAPPAMTSFVVNGQPQQVDEQSHDRLIDALRVGLRLTGAKESCSTGACGACTVLADGVAVLSCLLPTTAAAGRTIETVEGLGPRLHPVQRALMAHDGLQCGFCTPGVVMQGVAFHRRWRAVRGTAAPTRAEVNDAMAGHLCRCGAYVGIAAAITRACAGDFDGDTDPPSPRHNAKYKVTGAARYTVDAYPGRRAGRRHPPVDPRARQSPLHQHGACARRARSARRDLDARRGDGAVGGSVRRAGNRCRRRDGRPRRARCARLDRCRYQVLPAAIGMDGARADGAPAVYRLGGPRSPSGSELPLNPGRITTTSTGRSSSSRTTRSARRRRSKPHASRATMGCSNARGARRGNPIRHSNRTRRWPSGAAAID